jgi:outer membrane protein OmpA-like peptidoglycan-associated protein
MTNRNVTALGAIGLAGLLLMTGCAAMQKRKWGTCAQNGALIGFIVGGGTGGILVSEFEGGGSGGSTGEIAAGVAGGVVGGALVGAALGHLICDPIKEPPAPAPPPPPPPPAEPKRIELSADAHFDFGSATLKPEGQQRIDEIIPALQENPELRIMVEGYTDSVGSEAYNQRLSERRAEAVRSHMVAQGIAPERIDTRGYGEGNPVASNDTPEGRARNRRVVIVTE